MKASWLVCNDFSPQSDLLVNEAAEELEKLSGHLYLLHVYYFPPSPAALAIGGNEGLGSIQELSELLGVNARRRLEETKEALEKAHPKLKVTTVAREGNPVEEIVAAAAELNVSRVVVGTHSRKGVQRFLMGSVAERVVRLCSVSVLVHKTKQESVK